MNSTNAANGAKPRGKPFTGRDDPRRSNNGQRNKAAVAFARGLRELIVTEGESKLAVEGKKRKKVELLVRQLWNKALNGEPWAVQFIAERVEGKVPNVSELTGKDGGPIETSDVGLTDDERIKRLGSILERARQTRDRQAPDVATDSAPGAVTT